jgi:hypothetical protein
MSVPLPQKSEIAPPKNKSKQPGYLRLLLEKKKKKSKSIQTKKRRHTGLQWKGSLFSTLQSALFSSLKQIPIKFWQYKFNEWTKIREKSIVPTNSSGCWQKIKNQWGK